MFPLCNLIECKTRPLTSKWWQHRKLKACMQNCGTLRSPGEHFQNTWTFFKSISYLVEVHPKRPASRTCTRLRPPEEGRSPDQRSRTSGWCPCGVGLWPCKSTPDCEDICLETPGTQSCRMGWWNCGSKTRTLSTWKDQRMFLLGKKMVTLGVDGGTGNRSHDGISSKLQTVFWKAVYLWQPAGIYRNCDCEALIHTLCDYKWNIHCEKNALVGFVSSI